MSDAENNSCPHRIHEFNMGSEEGFEFPFFIDQMYNHPKLQRLQNPTHETFDLSYNNFFQGRYNPPFDPSTEADFAVKNCEIYKNLGETSSSAAAENSSVSIPSAETGVEEDSCRSKGDDQQAKVCEAEGGDLKPKKVKEKKNKVEKRERERRFAFVTKSEVDNLEDGYRWRKYGQKAVKNSSFPRSYYKCTSQKCNVKKLIERSYQDSSMVVTTYLGRHNHHSPATLRGRAAMLPPPHFNLPQSFLLHNSNFPYPSSLQLENMPPSLPDPLMLNMDYSSFL